VERRGYFVFGVEGSGTRILTKLMINAGAHGDSGHAQKFDSGLPSTDEVDGSIVWRRSFPHARRGVPVSVLAGDMRSNGWSPYALIIVRDTVANVRAQVPAHAGSIHEAWRKNQKEFSLMFMGVRGAFIPFEVLTYENVVARPVETQDYLGSLPGLRKPDSYVDINDANVKHWQAWRMQ